MSVLARFLVFFGASFLSLAVIIFSYLRRRMAKHSHRVKKRRQIERKKRKLINIITNSSNRNRR